MAYFSRTFLGSRLGGGGGVEDLALAEIVEEISDRGTQVGRDHGGGGLAGAQAEVVARCRRRRAHQVAVLVERLWGCGGGGALEFPAVFGGG